MNEPTEPNRTAAVLLKERTLQENAPAERKIAEQAPAKRTSADGDLMSHKQILQVLTGLLAALFTAMLSSTIVAQRAAHHHRRPARAPRRDFAWVVTAALLANAATTPIWGKLADLYNKKLLVQLSHRDLRGRLRAGRACPGHDRCCWPPGSSRASRWAA